ncbi:xylulokinase [Alkalibacterium pelagium]|uniref:Sugar (Pentulose or hexulose) kinase n=1 Tax=Alkalibacterium pelagium TaxID=426702 RepID=A0A1H7HBF5_9LACT|nr:FGGY-family carbohydrate kinase [Alkalibacterium pelagium]GEN51732.1 ATPase [Alkalibacterium pelagium]SEK47763.1 Sugar (pentulose or hexulose) kinase [Alkalibacterium pelagium]
MEQNVVLPKQKVLGIEFGSTRIKAVLINENFNQISSGSFEWENKLIDGYWTYSLDDVWSGLQIAYKELSNKYEVAFGEPLSKIDSIGFSGMMHGYLPFDKDENLLTPFRTWRNTTTEEAAQQLTNLFSFNIPQRWSIAHLHQAILNKEEHVKDITFLTTLAGYVHWKLTGKKVIGVGEAAGMFPIDSQIVNYNQSLVKLYENKTADVDKEWSLLGILPEVLSAGEAAGQLTIDGAKLIDPSGRLKSGSVLCPPEGDAGTGMVATNAVAERTGNVSAGTSVFSMIVLEEALSDYYTEIDMVTTPTGKPAAMVHCNNFTTDINAWARLFKELISSLGLNVSDEKLFTTLFNAALNADEDNGQLMSCNYYSGEPITGFEEGRPMFLQMPDSTLSLANFMRTHIYSALATLKMGMDILTQKENVTVDQLLGHGGFFKTEKVGQQMMSNALTVPVSVMESAGEGGPWGMALLASYLIDKNDNQSLENYLEKKVFSQLDIITLDPEKKGIESFNRFMDRYINMLEIEKTAINYLK